jgi:hypothetical protein
MRSILAALLFLYTTANASAGDYTVAYDLEVRDQKDAGETASCEYSQPCEIVSENLGLIVQLDFTIRIKTRRLGDRALHLPTIVAVLIEIDGAKPVYVGVSAVEEGMPSRKLVDAEAMSWRRLEMTTIPGSSRLRSRR